MLMMGAIGLLLVGGDAQELFFERQKQVFKKNRSFPRQVTFGFCLRALSATQGTQTKKKSDTSFQQRSMDYVHAAVSWVLIACFGSLPLCRYSIDIIAPNQIINN